MRKFTSVFRYFDLYIFSSSVLLLFLGLIMIYSTSLDSESNLLWRQIIFMIVGFVVMMALAFYDYRNLKKVTPWLFVFVIVSLLAVWILGPTIRGSARWIDLGFFRFQPSEFAKLFMVIITAKYLDQQGEKIKALPYVLKALIYIGIPTILILIQPDLGSAVVLFLTWFGMIMFSRMNKKDLALLLIFFTIIGATFWAYGLQDYQKQRLETFLDPNLDPQGQGYNVLQSIIAVGSGEIFGRGIGRGLQSQLKFLPQKGRRILFLPLPQKSLGF
jgi:rod shape determining protein RodA